MRSISKRFAFVSLCSVMFVGCGQGTSVDSASKVSGAGATLGGTPAGDSSSSSTISADVSQSMQKAQRATTEAQTAIKAAETAMRSIQDANGDIRLDLFQNNSAPSGVSTKGVMSPIIDKLRPTFDALIAKVQLVKTKFAEARQLLAIALSKLDHRDPAQARMIEEVMKQMATIDAAEAKFRASLYALAGKLDKAVAQLDKLLSNAANLAPGWGWIIGIGVDYFVMAEVYEFVDEVKAKLLVL